MNPYQHMYPPPPGYMPPPMHAPPPMGYPPYGLPPPPPGVPVARYPPPPYVVMPPMVPQHAATIAAAPAPPTRKPVVAAAAETVETTTIYVGKIPATVEDDFIRKLLEGCGEVALWRRVTDPSSGQLKGFAFCDYKSPEGVLRALRLLNNLAIDNSNLLLKVDEKNQKLLDAYTTKRNAEQHGILIPKPGQSYQQTPDALSKEKEEDDAVMAIIKELVDKQHTSLSYKRAAGKDDRDSRSSSHSDDKSTVVSREIKNFRERPPHKDKDKRDDDERADRDRDFDRQKERDRLRLLRDREREKDVRRKQREEKDFRDREREWEHRERKKEQDREEEKKTERRDKEVRVQEIVEQENEDEEYTKKKIRTRDARKRRQREREDDEIDRNREKDEIEQKRKEDEEKRKQEEIKQQELARIAAEEMKAQNEKRRMDELQQQRIRMQQQAKREAEQAALAAAAAAQANMANSPPQGDERESLRLGFNKRTKNPLAPSAGFAPEAEEEEQVFKKKRTLVPLYDTSKKDEAQSVIDRIPTTKEELFAVPVDWALIDKANIAQKKMKPWVGKKIVEYLGEEEKTLIEFIMSKITAHTPPDEVLTALVPILDEEASIFVVKMWRMLVYEMFTAAKA